MKPSDETQTAFAIRSIQEEARQPFIEILNKLNAYAMEMGYEDAEAALKALHDYELNNHPIRRL